jgi:hypothetical protein
MGQRGSRCGERQADQLRQLTLAIYQDIGVAKENFGTRKKLILRSRLGRSLDYS